MDPNQGNHDHVMPSALRHAALPLSYYPLSTFKRPYANFCANITDF